MRRCLPILAICMACSGNTDDDVTPARDGGVATTNDLVYETCARDALVGGITLDLRETFTSVQGSIANGVRPVDVPDVAQTVGTCELLRPATLFCDPPCGGGMTCGLNGCVALPSSQDVGTITISGLAAPIELTARAPVYFYNFTGDLPHPAFAAGDEVRLDAAGAAIEAFAIRTLGVDDLAVATATLSIDRNQPGALDWTPSTANEAVRVAIELNIANHGGTPGRVVCTTEDLGHFEIPAELVTALLDLGFSGFPTVSISRQGVGLADTGYGCVELKTRSRVTLPVEIPGLTSCSLDDDCPPGQTCQGDLTCQ